MLNIMSFLLQLPDISTILVFSTAFLVTVFAYMKPNRRLPPGPLAFPIVGNFPLMLWRKKLDRPMFLQELSKKYGDVFRLYFGPYMVVVLNKFEIMHNAFVKNGHIFSDRPNWLPIIDAQKRLGYGIVWENGEKWKRVRRLTLQTMRDLGVGKKSLEDIILDEVNSVDAIFEKSGGKPVGNVRHIMTAAISNVIHSIVFGFRYQHDDEKFHHLLDCFDKIFQGPGALSLEGFMPQFLKRKLARMSKRAESRQQLIKYITEQVSEHEKSFDENNLRDFMDLYIQQEKTEGNADSGKMSLFRVIFELFAAGTETTGTTLDWALLYMIAYPEVQQKCFEEIENAVGCNRNVNTSDRRDLPYLEATLMEVQRLGNTASGTLPHMSTEDSTINGYHIPKGTIVIGSLFSAHLDPNYWEDPCSFKPERFLGDKGVLKNPDGFIPFSLGPRICPGESLAKTEMFLMLSNILQKYKFSKVNETDELSFTGVTGITTCAPSYQLKAERRL